MGTIIYSSDKELLLALKNHDENAARYVYKDYMYINKKLKNLYNGNNEDADDIYQESILDFLEKVWCDDFILTAKLSGFFYSICKNKWLYYLRGGRSRPPVVDPDGLGESLFEPAIVDGVELPDTEQLQNTIDSLGDPCRTMLIGFYYEQLSMEELAKKLNLRNSDVAKARKCICLKRLTKRFNNPFNSIHHD